MRRLAVVTLLFVSIITSTLFAARPDHASIRALVGSCSASVIESCDTENDGRLETGDCLFDDGTRFDTFDFQGHAGQLIEITIRPLSPSYSKPWLALISPSGDVAEPPVIHGGAGGATIWYLLSSTGRWRLAVSSDDVFAGGDYVLHLYCYTPDPGQPQSCVGQYLLCGQEGVWSLSADSCRFSSVNKAFAIWYIYGLKGDAMEIEQTSLDFEPLFGIYDDAGNLLRSSTRDSSIRASMRYTVPTTGWYHILTTTVETGRGGDFAINLSCAKSGCIFPYLVNRIPTTVAAYGAPASIPFQANAVGGFTASLREDVAVVATSQTSPITTPPITSLRRFVLDLDNACGGWTSDSFIVVPDRMSKRRTVRR